METKEVKNKKSAKTSKEVTPVVSQEVSQEQKQATDIVEIRELLDKMRKVKVAMTKQKEEYEALETQAIEITKRNMQWFKDENGADVYTKNFGLSKIVWKVQSPKYEFPDELSKEGMKAILTFLRDCPGAYKISAVHSKMADLDLATYSITKKEFDRKLAIEV